MKIRKMTPKVVSLLLLFFLVSVFTTAAFVGDTSRIYNKLQRAFYISPDQVVYIRPGLNLTILDVTIPEDRRPVATFQITDDNDLPLDREGIFTPGSVATSFIMAYLPPRSDNRIPEYIDYSTRPQTSPITGVTADQASTDRGGTYTSLGDGTYTYKFGTVLPAGYNTAATHTLGIYATRDLREFGLSFYVSNEIHNFVPDGSPVTQIRQIAVTSACNQCHDPLAAHGETGRRDVKICILCHTQQTFDPDTGNTVDMKVMIHKIHMGENLPSVQAGQPYIIIGFNQSVADFSEVVFPQPVNNCTTCHRDSAQVNAWRLFPGIDACGSCHDNVNFATGENHPGGPQANNDLCSSCHAPQETFEYDASIPGAHTVDYKSTQLKNPQFTLLSITNTHPGQSPTIEFKITDKDGNSVAPSDMGRLAGTIGGPTTDYEREFQESMTGASYANGVATYTFSGQIPADATGTYAVELEGYLNTTIIRDGNPEDSFEYRDAGDNVVQYFAVTGTTVVPRRTVVALENCDKCHNKLQLHGNNRNQIDACVICHNPRATDEEVRPASEFPPQSIDFQLLVHSIHTGEELHRDFTVYGFRSSVNNYNRVLFPGDRRDCLQCHVDETFTVPLPAGVIPTENPRFYFTPTGPITTACTACHDSVSTAAHAFINSTDFGVSGTLVESCDVCHKETADFAVTKVHAR